MLLLLPIRCTTEAPCMLPITSTLSLDTLMASISPRTCTLPTFLEVCLYWTPTRGTLEVAACMINCLKLMTNSLGKKFTITTKVWNATNRILALSALPHRAQAHPHHLLPTILHSVVPVTLHLPLHNKPQPRLPPTNTAPVVPIRFTIPSKIPTSPEPFRLYSMN